MFGLYRLMLALLVVVTHLGSTEIFGGLAVWAFFMLSGFLITGVLNTRYTFSRQGLIEFGLSRALRLLPNIGFLMAWLYSPFFLWEMPTFNQVSLIHRLQYRKH